MTKIFRTTFHNVSQRFTTFHNVSQRFTTLVFLSMLFVNFSIAQGLNTDLFNLQNNNTRLTTSQNAKIVKMRDEMGVKDVKLIRIEDISKIQKNGKLKLKIPGTNLSFNAKATGVEKKLDGTLIWNGRMEGDEFGYIQYIQKGKDCLINFTYGTNSFQVISLGDGLHALKTLDVKKMSNGSCGVDHNNDKMASLLQNPENGVLRQESCPDNRIRVLILFTPAARIEQGANINLLPDACINQMNQALISSGIQQRQVELAGSQELNFVETAVDHNTTNVNVITNASNTDIERLASDPRVINPSNGLRNQFSADVVVLLTSREYFNTPALIRPGFPELNIQEVFGQVRVGTLANRTANNGFILSTAQSAIEDQRFTFIHEFGHIFGARHQRPLDIFASNFFDKPAEIGPDGNAGAAHAFDFRSRGVDWKTCLHSSSPRSNRFVAQPGSDNIFYFTIPKYSNPAIRHPTSSSSSANTGNSTNNNANQISLDFFTVRNYLPPAVGTLVSFIQGSSIFEPSNSVYEAVTRCGCAPFAFQWFFSTDGFNETLIGTDETVFIGQPGFLRLVTTSCDGQVSVSFFTVEEGLNCNFCPLVKANNEVQTQNNFYNSGGKITASMIIYPNPTTENSTIDYAVSVDGNVIIDLLNVSGKIIKSILNENLVSGYYRTELDTRSLENGVYFVKTQVGNDVFTQKLSIIK